MYEINHIEEFPQKNNNVESKKNGHNLGCKNIKFAIEISGEMDKCLEEMNISKDVRSELIIEFFKNPFFANIIKKASESKINMTPNEIARLSLLFNEILNSIIKSSSNFVQEVQNAKNKNNI